MKNELKNRCTASAEPVYRDESTKKDSRSTQGKIVVITRCMASAEPGN